MVRVHAPQVPVAGKDHAGSRNKRAIKKFVVPRIEAVRNVPAQRKPLGFRLVKKKIWDGKIHPQSRYKSPLKSRLCRRQLRALERVKVRRRKLAPRSKQWYQPQQRASSVF